MAISGFIFDVDGTLLDTNTSHVNAWHRALLKLGFEVPLDRIAPEIGKGGDKLIPSILGERVEEERGEELREVQGAEFLAIAGRTKFVLFDGAEELLAELRRRKIPTCIATSSSPDHFEAMLKASGVPLPQLVDHVVTKEEGMRSKPSPDLVQAAVEKLRLPANRCVMVGDTPHDGNAAKKAGVPFVGVLCGGNTADRLEAATARRVYRDPRALLSELDDVLAI